MSKKTRMMGAEPGRPIELSPIARIDTARVRPAPLPWRDKPSRPSAVEHRPADVVSQPLIVKDEFANRIRELFALPLALEPAGALSSHPGAAARAALIA